jgi:hypothetical protein
VTPRDVEDMTFRGNPLYELVLFDRLPPAEQEALKPLREDPATYGVLRPTAPPLTLKAVCRDTALLLYTLREPGPLPAYVKATLGAGLKEAVAALVLDGILEVEQDGTFVSGPAAMSLMHEAPPPIAPLDRIGRLSVEAVKYGQRLPIDDPQFLSARMYFYNREPASMSLRRRFPDRASLFRHLDLDVSGKLARRLRRAGYRRSDNPNGWVFWEQSGRDSCPLKLYVSPRIGALREAVHEVVEACAGMQPPVFKVGGDILGHLRPDKIMIYFRTLDHLRSTADRLATALGRCPAHGVPFTAALAGDGLLSWGADPPAVEQVPTSVEPQSWRLWVTHRLATWLLAAKRDPSARIEPWRFALSRIGLDGVDTSTWAPPAGTWQGSAA